MEVNERLEEPQTEEVLPEVTAEPVAGEIREQSAWTGPAWLRLAYVFEFLIALIAIFTLWSQVGGQGHLDLLPWYTKLACVLALAGCLVRFTAGIVEQQEAWNHRSILWFTGMLLVGIVMGGITFYYHLHEVPDESDSEDTTATSVCLFPCSSDQTRS